MLQLVFLSLVGLALADLDHSKFFIRYPVLSFSA